LRHQVQLQLPGRQCRTQRRVHSQWPRQWGSHTSSKHRPQQWWHPGRYALFGPIHLARARQDNRNKATELARYARTLARGFEEHREVILRFTTDLTVPFTNNQAERDIRSVKVQQRSSGGCWRTLQGLADFAIVQSYLSTAAKWGIGRYDALKRLCGNYIDNVKAYTQKEKVKNRFTGKSEDPDERLMRSIEEKIDIPESRKDDFRREIMNYIGALSIDGKTFDYKTNERLYKALELKLFEDQKDSIKLTSLVSNVVDAETQQKIDVVKGRLIRDHGYDEESATDVLNFVASIFARGDTRDDS
jgi:hypothetical protein